MPLHKPDHSTKTLSIGQRKQERNHDRRQAVMHIRPHHCRKNMMVGRTTIVLCLNYGNTGYGIQSCLGTMAGMQTNERTSGLKYTCDRSGKTLCPHRKSPGMMGNLVDQQIKAMGARGFAFTVKPNECLGETTRGRQDFQRKNGQMISPARNLHGSHNTLAQTLVNRRCILSHRNGGGVLPRN